MKLRAPSFWNRPQPGLSSTLLSPFERITRVWGQHRLKRRSHRVAVPVLCCGNINVGGTGKTPLTLHFVRLLQQRGKNPHIITRGYGGQKEYDGQRVDPHYHQATDVGDEALLLAQHAPTWRGANRLLSAHNAIAHGADCLVLDDGLQDPTLYKDFSILTIDGAIGLGNGHLLPAGPLRESLTNVIGRVQSVVLWGEDCHHIIEKLPLDLPVHHATLLPGPEIRSLAGRQCIAFAGLGRPEKFFTMLREYGVNVVRDISFPDHYIYTERDIHHLEQLSRAPGTILVTTEKDYVKLPEWIRSYIQTIKIDILWRDVNSSNTILDLLEKYHQHM